MQDQKSNRRDESISTPSSSARSAAQDQTLAQWSSEDPSRAPQALKGLAAGVVGEAKKVAESRVGTQKGRVAEGLGDVAHALRQAASARHEPVIETVRPYVDKAADRVERLSSYLQERSLRDIAGDLERFARREPALFLGGAFVAGLLGGRFLKAGVPVMTSREGNGSSSSASSSNGHDEIEKTATSEGNQGESSSEENSAIAGGAQAQEVAPTITQGLTFTMDTGDIQEGSAKPGEHDGRPRDEKADEGEQGKSSGRSS